MYSSLCTESFCTSVVANKAVDRFGSSRLSSISLRASISFINIIALKVQLEAESVPHFVSDFCQNQRHLSSNSYANENGA